MSENKSTEEKLIRAAVSWLTALRCGQVPAKSVDVILGPLMDYVDANDPRWAAELRFWADGLGDDPMDGAALQFGAMGARAIHEATRGRTSEGDRLPGAVRQKQASTPSQRSHPRAAGRTTLPMHTPTPSFRIG